METHGKVRLARVLGDLRAEADHEMLDRAFYQTLDFKTLLETSDKPIVVGRRGTGKSALVYALSKHWSVAQRKVIPVTPEDDQIIGVRPLVGRFGNDFLRVRAGSVIAWKYALIMELAQHALRHYKADQAPTFALLKNHSDKWHEMGSSTTQRLRVALKTHMTGSSPEEYIAELAQTLQLTRVSDSLREVFSHTGMSVVLLVDQLDEGYVPDEPGVGLLAGLVQAAIYVKTVFGDNVRLALFLRDNIFRTIAQRDPDYSRNIEGHVLRLHWDEEQLFHMVCNRLRAAFGIEQENNRRVWDACTASDLHGFDGFKKCLRLTLYRPRDVVSLLNEAFYTAARENSSQITLGDIEKTAKGISISRLDDLRKEYAAIVPAITRFTSAFANGSAELRVTDAEALLQELLISASGDPAVQQDIVIHGNAEQMLRTLYGVGFLGVFDPSTQTFAFCHDGTAPGIDVHGDGKVLVHPCYWMALNLGQPVGGAEGTQQINDEYTIQTFSKAPEVRNARIGSLISELGRIPTGTDGHGAFENWALSALKIAFSGHLSNIVLHPNPGGLQQRDVVGTNLGRSLNWTRVLADYGARQVIFEVKNYDELKRDDYRQVLSYLTDPYGRIAFFVTRDDNIEPRRGVELDWIRELWNEKKILVVKLTAKWLARLIAKLRNPMKHDVADLSLGTMLDTYQRRYIGGEATRKESYKKASRRFQQEKKDVKA